MSIDTYHHPVDKLLTLGESKVHSTTWFDYTSLGLTREHIPELITMIADDALHRAPSDSDKVWAPVHAWRALGQLRSVEAVPPILDQFWRIADDEDDQMEVDMPGVFEMIGPDAIPELIRYLRDQQNPMYSRTCTADCLVKIGIGYPEFREICLKAIEDQLRLYQENDPTFNGFLVWSLLDINAIESLPVIQEAFQADCVDLSVAGDCEDVEIELGVRTSRSTPRPRLWPSLIKTSDLIDIVEDFSDDDDENLDDDYVLDNITVSQPRRVVKIGRNEPCPCGSGKKYKKCCLNKEQAGNELETDQSS